MHSPAAANRGRRCKDKVTNNFCVLQKKVSYLFCNSYSNNSVSLPYETIHSNIDFTINLGCCGGSK